MGKHAADTDDHVVVSHGLGLPGRLALTAAGVVTVIGAGVLVGPGQALSNLPWAKQTACTQQTVNIVVSPEIKTLVQQILAPIGTEKLAGNVCASVDVTAQEPQDTVASADVLPLDRAPQLWIPDSAVWGQKAADRWTTRTAGQFAKTYVVIATSKNAQSTLGWAHSSPTWTQVLRGNRPVAVPDYRSSTESLDALIALWQTLGKGTNALNQVVATVAAADRGELPSQEAAIADARSGTSSAPLLPTTEQTVAQVNASSTTPNLVAVYPKEGSPVLDYPILQLTGLTPTAGQNTATQAVIARLTSQASDQAVRQAGFRGPTGGDPVGTGIVADYDKTLDPPSANQVSDMLTHIDTLSTPDRILAVLDVSLSMEAKLADGITRIDLSSAAARLGANVLPDNAAVGVWLFASGYPGGKDYKQLEPVKDLGSLEPDGETARSQLMRDATKNVQYLKGGGTGLYSTLDAAFKSMHRNYNPKAHNAIILLTDGQNDESGGPTLKQLLATIRKMNNSRQDVAIYAAGLGPDADYDALQKLATASGGHMYRINTALEGQEALLDGLRRSRNIGN